MLNTGKERKNSSYCYNLSYVTFTKEHPINIETNTLKHFHPAHWDAVHNIKDNPYLGMLKPITVIPSDKSIAIFIFQLSIDILLRLFQGNVHVAIQASQHSYNTINMDVITFDKIKPWSQKGFMSTCPKADELQVGSR